MPKSPIPYSPGNEEICINIPLDLLLSILCSLYQCLFCFRIKEMNFITSRYCLNYISGFLYVQMHLFLLCVFRPEHASVCFPFNDLFDRFCSSSSVNLMCSGRTPNIISFLKYGLTFSLSSISPGNLNSPYSSLFPNKEYSSPSSINLPLKEIHLR